MSRESLEVREPRLDVAFLEREGHQVAQDARVARVESGRPQVPAPRLGALAGSRERVAELHERLDPVRPPLEDVLPGDAGSSRVAACFPGLTRLPGLPRLL